MNIGRSGKTPDKLRKLAALLAALTITLNTACSHQTSSVDPPSPSSIESSEPISEETSDTSDATSEDNTHAPDTSDAQNSPENSDGSSESSNVSDSSDSSEDSSQTSETSETEESGSQTSSESSSEPESSSSSEPDPDHPPESSSEQSSSSVVEPDPPAVVVIPDVVVPTSPGVQTSVGANGWVDFSNASQGYISAKYTGNSGKLKLRIAGNGEKYDHDMNADGTTQYYPLSFGSGDYTVTLFEQVEGQNYGVVTSQSFSVQLSSSLAPFLCPNRYVNYYQGSDAVYKGAELCAGKTSTIDKVGAIFTWVANNVSYDYDLATSVTTGYVPDPDRTMARRTGICFDYASLMAAMLRSQSIPTRLVIGWASPEIYHAWNEVYTEETGWITPELMLKNAGYNIVDATFYSTSADKSQIAGYISNGANYTVRYYY